MIRVPVSAFALALMGLGSLAHAADAVNGLRIAQRWCAACHLVAPDQTAANADVPTFMNIAQRKPDPRSLASFIAEPHPKMPPMSLTRDEIADIVRYIQTLAPETRDAPAQEKDVSPPEPHRG